MTCGRGYPVSRNGAHEARPHMFPTCHSVTGERNYLSPLAAVWSAWKLRGEVFPHSFDGCCDSSTLHQGVFQFRAASVKSARCTSHEPLNVRRVKRVHFDDCIEVAVCTEHGCKLYSTFVAQDALKEWNDKPWHYCPKPPSRRFSWRKLTNLVYPFCRFDDNASHVISGNDGQDDLMWCPNMLDAEYGIESNGNEDAFEAVYHENVLSVPEMQGKRTCSDVLRDITNLDPDDLNQVKGLHDAPLSILTASSSHQRRCFQINYNPINSNQMPTGLLADKENCDEASVVQTGRPIPRTLQNSPMNMQQAFQLHAFQEGHAQHFDGNDDTQGEGSEGSAGYSPDGSPGPSEVQSLNSDSDRQDVILFHLDDHPIRAFINWNSYEEMITEIAHHFGLRREDVVEAYEVVVSPPDIGIEVVPTIVHVFGDIPPESTDRLVLVDIEYHARRIEHNFEVVHMSVGL